LARMRLMVVDGLVARCRGIVVLLAAVTDVAAFPAVVLRVVACLSAAPVTLLGENYYLGHAPPRNLLGWLEVEDRRTWRLAFAEARLGLLGA